MEALLETMGKSFDLLNPYEKARFMDARLGWASSGAICTEVHIRMCKPIREENSTSND